MAGGKSGIQRVACAIGEVPIQAEVALAESLALRGPKRGHGIHSWGHRVHRG